MGYETRKRQVYMFAEFDYGGASGARADKIVLPKDKGAILIDYGVQNVTENFAGTTTEATIAVGDSDDPDAFGEELELNDATTTLGGYTVRSTYNPANQNDKDSFDDLIVDREIPAGTTIVITNTEATGSPAGKGQPYVVLDIED